MEVAGVVMQVRIEALVFEDIDQVPASETDEAEERAILFAITELRNRLKRFTVICDHESAVTKVNWKGDDRKKAKKDKVLPEIWKALDENRSVKVRALGGNPAHGLLSKRLKELDLGQNPTEDQALT